MGFFLQTLAKQDYRISLSIVLRALIILTPSDGGHYIFEGFQILCTDYDYILEKRGDSIQGRTLFKEIRYPKRYPVALKSRHYNTMKKTFSIRTLFQSHGVSFWI